MSSTQSFYEDKVIPRVNKNNSYTSSELLELVKSSLDDDKALDMVVIDLSGKTSIADYMVIASGRSTRQVVAMAKNLADKLKSAGLGRVPIEGESQGDWVLVDSGDVIVHLFRPEVRSFYNIEKMWGENAPLESGPGAGGEPIERVEKSISY